MFIRLMLILLGSMFFIQCSTKKTDWAHRYYHGVVTRFNPYFNANELMIASEIEMNTLMADDYTHRLLVYKELNDENRPQFTENMDLVLEKCAKSITKHGISKGRREYNKWVDDCYLLIGKAYYYTGDDIKSFKVLNQVAKKYRDQESRFDGRFWLARLAAKEGDYEKSMQTLSILIDDPELPDRLRMDISKLYTSNYLVDNNIEKAISNLQDAITNCNVKKERIRLTFLLGQLYTEIGNNAEAMIAFAQVLDLHPNYEVEFYARIEMASAYQKGDGDSESVREELLKMLSDEKYDEFRDQIYYSLAQIALENQDIPLAISYLNSSTEVSITNPAQKAKSYLKLGELYFAEPNYVAAQLNYDSCVVYLSDDYPEAEVIRNLTINLTDLVAQIVIISHQDSIQKVARMTETERNALISDIIKNRKEEEKRKNIERRNQVQMDADKSLNGLSPLVGTFNPDADKWYFYNDKVRAGGQVDFTRVWGRRSNSDNWRRSDKAIVLQDITENEKVEEPTFIVDASGDTMVVSNDWDQPSFYMQGLPFSEDLMLASDNKIIAAYYQLAIIYKEQMNDIKGCISTLETLENKYNPNTHTSDSYFRLYTMYLNLGNMGKANFYKSKILEEFPDSMYAKVINDPDYLAHQNLRLIEAMKAYQKIYTNYYQRGFYQQTMISCADLLKAYPDTEITAKISLLNILSKGHLEGKQILKSGLQNIISEYSDTKYALEAKSLLDGLKIHDQLVQAEVEAQAEVELKDKQARLMSYTFTPDMGHNFVILVSGSGNEVNFIKDLIRDFNKRSFADDKLNMSSNNYERGKQLITVKGFKNLTDALTYQKAFENYYTLFDVVKDNPTYFVISLANYAAFYKARDHLKYKIWSDVYFKDIDN